MNFEFSHEQSLIAEAAAGSLARKEISDPAAIVHELDHLGLFDHSVIDSVTGIAVAIEMGKRLAPAPWADMLAAAISFNANEMDPSALAAGHRLLAFPLEAEIDYKGSALVGTALMPALPDMAILPSGNGEPGQYFLAEGNLTGKGEVELFDPSIKGVRIGIDCEATQVRCKQSHDFAHIRTLLLLGEMVGAAQACLEQTVEYAKGRNQFGQPIGSFQAVKHMAADAAMQIEAMLSAVQYAAWCADSDVAGDSETEAALLTARAIVGEQAKRVAENCVQMHGGIAFTWDYGLHHLLKRIVFWGSIAARPREANAELAAGMLRDPELMENAMLGQP